MRISMVFIAIIMCLTLGSYGQITKEKPSGPQTKFEQFQGKDGIVRITEFYDLPAPKSQFGTVEAKLINSKDASSPASAIGLRISYNSGKEYASDSVDFLDEDEITSLSNALDYVIRNQQAITAQAKTYTEITYVSRGGFRTGFFLEPKEKKTGYYAEVNGESVFFDDLSGLKDMVSEAKHQIDAIHGHP